MISFLRRNNTIFILLTLFFMVAAVPVARADTATPTKAELEAELNQIEAQIAGLQGQLATTQSQKAKLAAEISSLQTQEAVLRLQIKKTNLVISDLNTKLDQTKQSIQQNVAKTKAFDKEITLLLDQMNKNDDSLFVSVFDNGGLTAAFQDFKDYATISSEIADLTAQTRAVKVQLDSQQTQLGQQQDDAQQLLSIKAIQQQSLVDKLSEQKVLLAQTKGKEATYESQISDSQKQAEEIRNRIYQLFEGNTTVTFGQAVSIAENVSQMTGVEAPFLLAILTQESNLGQNVGTCNRPGDPPSKSWRVVMKPDRDQQPFIQITQALGLNTDTTPVSCPMHNSDGSQLGWGGAMGPAQFIPSTWMGYISQISAYTGEVMPNPWDIRDAFLAAAIKLKADGANNTSTGEWDAAMRYFSGSLNTRYSFYGDNVLALTQKYKSDISTISS